MNYFELFEIPVSLSVSGKEVQLKYFELQKKYHPDFFSNADENEQDESHDGARDRRADVLQPETGSEV